MNKQLLEKLEQFQKAYHELDNAWSNVIDNDDMNSLDAIHKDYPFGKSFDEYDIDKWVKSAKKYKSFEEGNFLVIYHGCDDKWIYIFKAIHDIYEDAHYHFWAYGGVAVDRLDYQQGHCLVRCENARLATDEEKELLLTKLHEVGKDWNPETMKIVKYKWKPKIGNIYYVPSMHEDDLYEEYRWADDRLDKHYFDKGLICKTKEEAIEVAKKMLKVLE